jgi:hypothetical protein
MKEELSRLSPDLSPVVYSADVNCRSAFSRGQMWATRHGASYKRHSCSKGAGQLRILLRLERSLKISLGSPDAK